MSSIAPVQPQASTAPVTEAIRTASQRTGVSFDYLLRTATRESSLDPNARAPTTSATGLFQFLDQTWLAVVREAGPQHGLAAEAGEIERSSNGRYTVADASERQRILDLRRDPTLNAVMGAAFTRMNADQLSQALGRAPTDGELYMAHFLGAGGASQFLTQAARTPSAPAATDFPDAASANRSIFYGPNGQARSYADVRERLIARHGASDTVVQAALEMGRNAEAVPVAPTPDSNSPIFHSLFQSNGRGPVSQVVQSLWGSPPAAAQPLGYAAPAPVHQPFFPSSVLRVGEAPSSTPTTTATNGQTTPDIAATFDPVAAAASSTAAAPIQVPLPLPRPSDLTTRAVTPTTPATSSPAPELYKPLDLLAFTRRSFRS